MRSEMSTYYSDCGTKVARVFYNSSFDRFEIDYIQDNYVVKTESFEDRSIQYHEDFAEDYVMGIRKI